MHNAEAGTLKKKRFGVQKAITNQLTVYSQIYNQLYICNQHYLGMLGKMKNFVRDVESAHEKFLK